MRIKFGVIRIHFRRFLTYRRLRVKRWANQPSMHLIRVLVTCSLLGSCNIYSFVKVSSCSRSFDCMCGLFDPKFRASMMCLSGFVYLHSFTKIHIVLRKESNAPLSSCFMVRSLKQGGRVVAKKIVCRFFFYLRLLIESAKRLLLSAELTSGRVWEGVASNRNKTSLPGTVAILKSLFAKGPY